MAYIREVRGHTPQVGENTFLAETAVLVGDVTVGRDCSIWYNAVLRGDVNTITIGDRTNIQDGVVIHTLFDGSKHPSQTHIGNDVSVGHNAVIHGAIIEDNCLVGQCRSSVRVHRSGQRTGAFGQQARTQFGLCGYSGQKSQGDNPGTTGRDRTAYSP